MFSPQFKVFINFTIPKTGAKICYFLFFLLNENISSFLDYYTGAQNVWPGYF